MGRCAEQYQDQEDLRQSEEMFHAELHYTTIEALKKCVDVLTAEEISILCYNCGIQPKELK